MEVPVLGREEDGAGRAGPKMRGQTLGLPAGQELDLDPEAPGQVGVPPHPSLALGRKEDPHGADTREPDRPPGGLFEPGQSLHGLVHQPDHQLGRYDLRREAGGAGGRLRAESVAIEQDDVAGAAPGQVIGGARSESPRTDDDDAGFLYHDGSPSLSRTRYSSPR